MSIVLGYDESPGSRPALATAISLAQRFEEQLVLVYGVEPPGGVGEEFQAHQRALAELGRTAVAHAVEEAERAGVPAKELSYGDRRRLEIARALAGHPTLLILDEPAAGMNHVEAQGLSTLIRSLADDGLTVLLIEHNVRMVLETCTRIVVLNFGEVIAAGDPATVAKDPAVVEAYLGSDGQAGTRV